MGVGWEERRVAMYRNSALQGAEGVLLSVGLERLDGDHRAQGQVTPTGRKHREGAHPRPQSSSAWDHRAAYSHVTTDTPEPSPSVWGARSSCRWPHPEYLRVLLKVLTNVCDSVLGAPCCPHCSSPWQPEAPRGPEPTVACACDLGTALGRSAYRPVR